jgi:hypothetical protein
MGKISKSTLAKIGGGVIALATLISVPGATGVIGDVAGTIGDHPVPWVLGFIAAVVLTVAYWDQLLRQLGIQTRAAVRRQVRDWLDRQHYTVQSDPAPGLDFHAVSPGGQPFAINRNSEADFLDVVFAVGFSDEHKKVMANASPATMRQLAIDLDSVFLSAPRTSTLLTNSDHPADLEALLVVHTDFKDLTDRTFSDALLLAARCGVLTLKIMGNTAETLVEQAAKRPSRRTTKSPPRKAGRRR